MKSTEIIERVLVELLGERIEELVEWTIVWEDPHILSIRWSLRQGQGTAKILKLPSGGWSLLSREI